MEWHFDPALWIGCVAAASAYARGARRYAAVRRRAWPRHYSAWFAVAIMSALIAIESPLDAAGDVRFAPHMVQHLLLTDVTAPALLLAGPFLLVLGSAPTRAARRIVALLGSRVGTVLASPPLGWACFMVVLWTVHYSPFFALALTNEAVHGAEHVLFIGAAILFWLPVIAVGPTPWSRGPLAYPLRMLYLLLAMPAEGMLGFTLHSARHILYAPYVAAGLSDQHNAGEIMWIGSTLCMFVAFMLAGWNWAKYEQRLGERANLRAPG